MRVIGVEESLRPGRLRVDVILDERHDGRPRGDRSGMPDGGPGRLSGPFEHRRLESYVLDDGPAVGPEIDDDELERGGDGLRRDSRNGPARPLSLLSDDHHDGEPRGLAHRVDHRSRRNRSAAHPSSVTVSTCVHPSWDGRSTGEVPRRDRLVGVQLPEDHLHRPQEDVGDREAGRWQRGGLGVEQPDVDLGVVRVGVGHRRLDGDGIDVDRHDRREPEAHARDRENARAAADVEEGAALGGRREELDAEPRRRMRTGAERTAGVDHDRASGIGCLLPGRPDPEPPDGDRVMEGPPRVLPSLRHRLHHGIRELAEERIDVRNRDVGSKLDHVAVHDLLEPGRHELEEPRPDRLGLVAEGADGEAPEVAHADSLERKPRVNPPRPVVPLLEQGRGACLAADRQQRLEPGPELFEGRLQLRRRVDDADRAVRHRLERGVSVRRVVGKRLGGAGDELEERRGRLGCEPGDRGEGLDAREPIAERGHRRVERLEASRGARRRSRRQARAERGS